MKDRFRPAVWDLAQDPSGGRIRFRTDSTTIGLIAENPGFSNMHHMASADFVNLGFSGNGLGEPALAEAICGLDPSCIVLDFWGNPSADQYAAALPVFVKILRQKWPRLPILVTSPFYFPAEETEGGVAREQTAKRLTARGFVEQRAKAEITGFGTLMDSRC